MSDFPIQVERLMTRKSGQGRGEGAEAYQFEVSADWWKAREAEGTARLVHIETPFCFDLSIGVEDDSIQIHGVLKGQVALECGRCAKRYSHRLRERIRLILGPAQSAGSAGASGPSGPMDPEGERALAEHGLCLGEDLEAGWFRGPVIGLDDFLGEVIALAMPLQPLCDEACPGVCSHCGVNLAENRCDCEDEKIESPFAVLAALKTKQD